MRLQDRKTAICSSCRKKVRLIQSLIFAKIPYGIPTIPGNGHGISWEKMFQNRYLRMLILTPEPAISAFPLSCLIMMRMALRGLSVWTAVFRTFTRRLWKLPSAVTSTRLFSGKRVRSSFLPKRKGFCRSLVKVRTCAGQGILPWPVKPPVWLRGKAISR